MSRKGNGTSLLGTLLVSLMIIGVRRKALEVLLSFDDLPEDVFYNVVDLSGSSLITLQAATIFLEYKPAMSDQIAVLEQIRLLASLREQADFLGLERRNLGLGRWRIPKAVARPLRVKKLRKTLIVWADG